MSFPAALHGVTVPVVTPFAGDAIDWDAYDALLAHVSADVDAVFPCGTTGEFASLSSAERQALVAHTVDQVGDHVVVLAGGSTSDVPDTLSWLNTVADLGADAGVITAPFFHGPNDHAGLAAFFTELADRSPLPLILYNIPSCVGTTLEPSLVVDLAAHDEIIGFKDSSGDLAAGLAVLDQTPEDFLVLPGIDVLVLPAARMGVKGCVSAMANVVPGAYAELLQAPNIDRARTIHRDVIQPLFSHCLDHGFAPTTKAALVAADVLDSPAVRPPLVSTDPEVVAEDVDRARAACGR